MTVDAPAPQAIAGVFVGGLSTRMGGRPKGLLEAPSGGTVVERCCAVIRAGGVAELVLVGNRLAYSSIPIDGIDDQPAGVGPLGGLVALLATARNRRHRWALAFACDMPFVSSSLVERLLRAPDAPVVAPRREGRWEPLCARYDATLTLPMARRRAEGSDHSLQRLLGEAGAVDLSLSPAEARELDDWDHPDDLIVPRP